jgi:glycosyltransferase involved in cell wall biosynthesis
MTPLRVGLDLRSGREAWLGGVYYLQNLALAVQTLTPEDRPELVALAPVDDPGIDFGRFEQLVPLVRFRGGTNAGVLRTKALQSVRGVVRRNADPPVGAARAARRAQVDLLFPTLRASRSGPRVLPWIYDLQHLEQPELFSSRERSFRTRAFGRAARSGRLVVLSSLAMATAFVARFPAAAGKVRVLRFTTVPGRDWLDADPAEVRDRYGLASDFLLLPGQLWAHKGHLTAFAALDRLQDVGTDTVLVCTGSTDDYRNPRHLARLHAYLDDHGLVDRVRILGVVPRADYIQLIRAATLVIQPSRYEGWSSVVEDARALGKRMVLSDIAVHLEQEPPGATYFRTGDPDDLARQVIKRLEQAQAMDERAALLAQSDRVTAYGRTFCEIVRETAEAD